MVIQRPAATSRYKYRLTSTLTSKSRQSTALDHSKRCTLTRTRMNVLQTSEHLVEEKLVVLWSEVVVRFDDLQECRMVDLLGIAQWRGTNKQCNYLMEISFQQLKDDIDVLVVSP